MPTASVRKIQVPGRPTATAKTHPIPIKQIKTAVAMGGIELS